MYKWYIKDEGKTTLYGDEEEIAMQHPSAILVPDRPDSSYIWTNGAWMQDSLAYRAKRVKEYPPLGDQLDALLRHFATQDPTNLMPDLNAIVQQWHSIKVKYPKP